MAEAPRDADPVWSGGTLALLVLAPAFFASNNIAARLADGTVPPATLAFFRWAVTAAILVPLLAPGLWRKRRDLAAEAPHLAVLAFTGIVVASVATYAGALWTTAINIGLIYSATPALILALDWASTGRPVSPGQVAGLALCCLGVLLIVLREGLIELSTLAWSPGDLVGAAGAVGWAIYSVLLKRWPSRLDVPERASVTAAAGALMLLPLVGLEAGLGHTVTLGAKALLVVATVGLLAGVGVVLAHAHLTARLGPRGAGVLLYLIPLYNTALAWVLLGERVHAVQAIGGALILGGVFLATAGLRRGAPLPATPPSPRPADAPRARSPHP